MPDVTCWDPADGREAEDFCGPPPVKSATTNNTATLIINSKTNLKLFLFRQRRINALLD